MAKRRRKTSGVGRDLAILAGLIIALVGGAWVLLHFAAPADGDGSGSSGGSSSSSSSSSSSTSTTEDHESLWATVVGVALGLL